MTKKLELHISGFRYFLKEGDDEVNVSVDEGKLLDELLSELGLEPEIIGYFILNGTPVKRDSRLKEGGSLKLIPFLSGG